MRSTPARGAPLNEETLLVRRARIRGRMPSTSRFGALARARWRSDGELDGAGSGNASPLVCGRGSAQRLLRDGPLSATLVAGLFKIPVWPRSARAGPRSGWFLETTHRVARAVSRPLRHRHRPFAVAGMALRPSLPLPAVPPRRTRCFRADVLSGVDLVARAGADGRIAFLTARLGASGASGRRAASGDARHQKTSSRGSIANEDGLVQVTELQVQPGQAATPSDPVRALRAWRRR